MVVPIPFTRAAYLYGDPIVIDRSEDVESARRRVEQVMNDLAEKADNYFK